MHVLDANEIFWMTFYTVDRILESGNTDALALYIRYMKQSRMQDTSKTFSLDEFMWKWLWWWHNRFYKAKKVLKELWLIDVIKTMWPDWKFVDNYVRVNYLIDENRIRTLGTTYELIHSPQNAESGKQGEEMLININKNNTLNEGNSNLPIKDDKSLSNSFKQKNVEGVNVNGKQYHAPLDKIKNSDDIRELLDEDEISKHNIQLKILLKMINLWYKVNKTKTDLMNEFEWLKNKAKLYGLIQWDGNIAWNTFYQKIDKWYDWHTEKNKPVKNFKTSIIPFISK